MRRAMGKDLKDRWKNISLLILDVDGVMTDGRIIMSDDGKEWKQFDVKDGHGIKMLLRSGVGVVLLTGRSSGWSPIGARRRCSRRIPRGQG